MSINAIAGNTALLGDVRSCYQRIRNEFQQFEQGIRPGGSTAEKPDPVTLSQPLMGQLSGVNPFGQTLSQIGKALQSGDMNAAQTAFAGLSSVGPTTLRHHLHSTAALAKGLTQLGQALQSGNLQTAQQAYAAVQQLWQGLSGTTAGPQDAPVRTVAQTNVTA